MRVVMLTNDGRAIDRRILLEAETVADLGHDVIVIARNESGSGVLAERIGRIKCMWIDVDLSYLGGSKTPVDLSWLTTATAAQTPAIVATQRSKPGLVRRFGVPLYLWIERRHLRATSRLAGARSSWGHTSITGMHRLRLAFGILRAGASATVLHGLYGLAHRALSTHRQRRVAAGADTRQTVQIDRTSFDLSLWEEALYHRAVYLDPDLIHAHDLPQLLPAVLATRDLGVPLIYDAHEIYSEIATLTPEQRQMLADKEAALIGYCTAKIAVNPMSAAFMQQRYGGLPVDVILNATIAPPGHQRGQSDDRLRKRLGIPATHAILLFQGWMADVGRGLRELVGAMAHVRPDVHLVMMGYGDQPQFEALARRMGVADRVHILPPVPWDELVLWSSAADVGVIPYQPVDFNHKVCSPNKLFEFISAGLPILANDLPYLTEVIEGEGFGITRTMASPASMAAAINEMFDPSLGHIARARANLIARAHLWEWPREAEKLQAIYRRISGAAGGYARPKTQ